MSDSSALHLCRSNICQSSNTIYLVSIVSPLIHLLFNKVLTDEVSPDLLVGASLGWGMSITTNDELVDALQESGLVQTEHVAAAMRALDRAWFAPQEERGKSSAPLPGEGCYSLNNPTKIGFGATISSPQIQAQLLEVTSLMTTCAYSTMCEQKPNTTHLTMLTCLAFLKERKNFPAYNIIL